MKTQNLQLVGGVVVSGSFQGFDQSYLHYALQRLGNAHEIEQIDAGPVLFAELIEIVLGVLRAAGSFRQLNVDLTQFGND